MDEPTRSASPPDVHAPASGVPPHGDLVVASDAMRPGHYTIRQAPGTPQLSLASEALALEVAGRLARDHGVDVWLETDGSTSCVRRHRRHGRHGGTAPTQPEVAGGRPVRRPGTWR